MAAVRVQPAAKVAPLPASKPTRVVIPSLDVDTAPIGLGLDGDGAMEVPQGADPVGWYTGAPTPGAIGPAVLAAHVNWDGQRGAFFELGAMKPGQTVEVDRQDGRTAIFTVTEVQKYAKDAFPTGRVYGNLNHAGLRLITCGGEFDRSTGHYEDNVVAYAELTEVR